MATMSAKTHPETLKVLVALAVNLRESAANVRASQQRMNSWNKQDYVNEYEVSDYKNDEAIAFQARAMYHALYNAFFIAKKAAGRKKLF